MAEINIKIDVPQELKLEFEEALATVVKQFIRRVKFATAEKISSKSKLTEKKADELADELKERISKRHGL